MVDGNLGELGLGGNLAVFVVASLVVWFAGDRLARGADAIAKRAGIGQAFIGVMLLGVMVSLPELTFSAMTAARGSAELAVNSLLGGIGLSMVVVAITDVVAVREPLSLDIRRPIIMVQGVMVTLMLTVAAAGITTGDVLLPGIGIAGLWTTLLVALYVLALVLVKRLESRRSWTPDGSGVDARNMQQPTPPLELPREPARDLKSIVVRTALAGAAVVVAATVLALSAELLAEQTGLGESFVGFLFGGMVTTLPELSTMISSVRLGRFEMTFSDAFGTNLCSIGLIFLADALYRGGPILNEVGGFSAFGVLLGIALTQIYLIGIIVRRKRPILRMGIDSLAVLVVALGGFVILYLLS